MNTIIQDIVSSPITNSYNEFIQKNSLELFKSIVVSLKVKSRKEGLTADEHLLYNLIRGLNPNRGFITMQSEFTQGYISTVKYLKYKIKYFPNDGLLGKMSPETLEYFLTQVEK